MKKIKLGDLFYTPIVRSQRTNGKEQVMWEITPAEVIGIRKSKFEGRWSDEELSEEILIKVKIQNEEFCYSAHELEHPEDCVGFTLFSTIEEADDYALSEIANDYYDGDLDEDNFVIENRTIQFIADGVKRLESQKENK